MLRTLIQGGSILLALRKRLQGVRRGIQATYKCATKGEGSMSIKDYCWGRKTRHQAKKLIFLLCMGTRKPPDTEFVPFICTSRAKSLTDWLFPPFNTLFTERSDLRGGWLLLVIPWIPQKPGWQCLLDRRHCFPLGEPSFTFGGPKLPMAVTFLAHWYGRKYFISHNKQKSRTRWLHKWILSNN